MGSSSPSSRRTSYGATADFGFNRHPDFDNNNSNIKATELNMTV